MKTYVVIPTYNESRNIEPLIREILGLGIADLNILVVDDHSPDGTAGIVTTLAERHPEVVLAERLNDKGRGTAGIVGFDLAFKAGAERIVEMDADFSHPPSQIPRLLDALQTADIAIASRLAPGARDHRPGPRRFLTVFANRYTRFFLERPFHRSRVRDWTTGFRAYRRSVFEKLPTSTLVSRGPSILQEILFRALNQGVTAVEIPFEMKDRAAGVSTFNRKIARQSFLSIPAYRILHEGTGISPEFRLDRYRVEKAGNRVTLTLP